MNDTTKTLARTAADLVDKIVALPESHARRLIAVAGAPGSGKSTLSEVLIDGLLERGHSAVLMPMDGFHLDDRLLEPRGLLPRKGAPETFDFDGFASTLRRVRDEPCVILPVFDRSREIAIAGAQEIRPETRIVVVEGNYLCFDEMPWRTLMEFWDLAVFLDVPMDELERRLIDRWLSHGFDPAAAEAKARGNDIANAVRVQRSITRVDLIIKP